MKKINLTITGCMGRMGQQLIKSSKKNKSFKLVSLTVNKVINKKITGIKLDQNNVNEYAKQIEELSETGHWKYETEHVFYRYDK